MTGAALNRQLQHVLLRNPAHAVAETGNVIIVTGALLIDAGGRGQF